MSLQTNLTQSVERVLDAAAQRHRLIVSNMANVDTPGYRAIDFDFSQVLADAVRSSGTASPQVREVKGLTERPDGNNVSLDRESLALAETQLQFRTAVQVLRKEFRMMMSAIQEGRMG